MAGLCPSKEVSARSGKFGLAERAAHEVVRVHGVSRAAHTIEHACTVQIQALPNQEHAPLGALLLRPPARERAPQGPAPVQVHRRALPRLQAWHLLAGEPCHSSHSNLCHTLYCCEASALLTEFACASQICIGGWACGPAQMQDLTKPSNLAAILQCHCVTFLIKAGMHAAGCAVPLCAWSL